MGWSKNRLCYLTVLIKCLHVRFFRGRHRLIEELIDLGIAVTGEICERLAGDGRGRVQARGADGGMAAGGEWTEPEIEIIFLKNFLQHHGALEPFELDINPHRF